MVAQSRRSTKQVAAGQKAASATMPSYDCVALVLQGGGALGSYQAGVFEGLTEAGVMPDTIAGISIGSLNTALIAGNPPERRVERMRQFWETVCQPTFIQWLPPFVERSFFNVATDAARTALTAMQAGQTLLEGQRGFFTPRFPPPSPFGGNGPGAASYYDIAPLKETLESLCDFDLINNGPLKVSVGAVNVRNGNFAYFENHGPRKTTLRAEHFMASGALPPGFPAVEIDGEYYWDGGLVSNTPLEPVLGRNACGDTLVFQVDLWSAKGEAPDNMLDVSNRAKDIQFSSRTRMVTEFLHYRQSSRRLLREVLAAVPDDVRQANRWCQLAEQLASNHRFNVLHLIYQDKEYEGHYKDYQFGLTTMLEHWRSGLDDIRRTLANPKWLAKPDNDSGFVTHDIHRGS